MQQPPLSRQIAVLEREMNARLFRRLARGVELTSAGQALFREARTILAQCDRALETTIRAARGEHGSLCVGVTPTSSFHPLVPLIIRSFRERFPRVSLTLEESLTTDIIQRLQSGQMDAAFFRPETGPPKELEVKLLLTERMVVALPRGHALARGNDSLAMKDLRNEAFIVFARQGAPTFYEATIAACLRAGFSARIGQETPRVTSALPLVAAGLGICIVPASMQRMGMDGVTFRELKSAAPLKADLKLVKRRSDHSPVVRNFSTLVSRLAEQFKKQLQQRP
jgi:DNA-binding transcriptional LysR family regulator